MRQHLCMGIRRPLDSGRPISTVLLAAGEQQEAAADAAPKRRGRPRKTTAAVAEPGARAARDPFCVLQESCGPVT